MRAHLLTAALLAVALCLALVAPERDADRELAQELLGTDYVEAIDMPGPPAFRTGGGTVLFFEHTGVQGPVRGAILVEGDRISDMVLLESREGLDHTTLDRERFQAPYRGHVAKPPIVVDEVSGATISSQALAKAVSERLKQWQTLAP